MTEAEPPNTPERRLLFAIILLALRDATSTRTFSTEVLKQKHEAIEWVFEGPEEPLREMSCRWICSVLDISWERIAAVVEKGEAIRKRRFDKYLH